MSVEAPAALDNSRRPRVAALVAASVALVAASVAVFSMAVAGWVHLEIAPVHFDHAPAHGLFFGILGVLQVAWAAMALVGAVVARKGSWGRGHWWVAAGRISGLALSGGAVVLWLLTQWVRTPFAASPEPIDGPTVLSKLAEGLCALALLVPIGTGQVPSWRPRVAAKLVLSKGFVRAGVVRAGLVSAVVFTVLSGVAMWAGGLAAEEHFVSLRPDPAQAGHDHSEHLHFGVDGDEPPSFAEYTRSALGLVRSLLAAQDYEWQLPAGFPLPRVPEHNPMTTAKVELGRHLFYDRRLSGNGEQSCASCHRQERAFSDGLELARGSTGEIHPRNSMALVNVAYNATLTWAHPQLEQLEEQIRTPMFGLHPVEMGITGHEEEVLARLRQAEVYETLFRDAFPGVADPVTWDHIIRALASFSRALISGDSAYDRFAYGGDEEALSPAARRGMELFLSEDFECHHCHGGFNFSVASVHQGTAFAEKVFHNTGLYDLGGGNYPHGNQGVFEITHRQGDMGKFRPPTLRNVALTAPYMHDGSIATLEEVIETYAAGGRRITTGPYAGDGRKNPHKSGFVPGFPITQEEKSDLLAFLHALTDESFVQDPRFADPFAGATGEQVSAPRATKTKR